MYGSKLALRQSDRPTAFAQALGKTLSTQNGLSPDAARREWFESRAESPRFRRRTVLDLSPQTSQYYNFRSGQNFGEPQVIAVAARAELLGGLSIWQV